MRVTRADISELMKVRMDETSAWPAETWQDYAAPILCQPQANEPELVVATYGMLPKRFLPPGKKNFTTLNARAETIGQKPAYANAWRRGQTCLVPMRSFREPNYESGRAAWWSIGMADDAAFCVAGLWRAWEEAEDGLSFSFTQITINADEHALMRRFHKPADEKRSLVIVARSDYSAWLSCRDPVQARAMLSLYPAHAMQATPTTPAGATGMSTLPLF